LEAVLRRCARGRPWDEGAWSDFVRLYKDHIFSLAHRMLGNCEDAGDVVVEVFKRMSCATWRTTDPMAVTLRMVKIACSVCLDMLRRRKVRNCELHPSLLLDEPPVSVEELAIARSDPRYEVKIEAALRRLSPKRRMVVLLCWVIGLTPREAAAALVMTPPAVRRLLSEARKQLRDWLGPDPLSGM
jgi:RNA polymerase sigma-70 factor (ECF subfamily)